MPIQRFNSKRSRTDISDLLCYAMVFASQLGLHPVFKSTQLKITQEGT